MTIDELKTLKVARFKTQDSLLFFTRYFFKKRYNRKFVVNRHHEIICDALERVMRGEITRLIINIAPRYGKTELAVKNFIAHSLSINPSAKFIHLSYSDDLALDNSEEIKDMILSDEYQTLFPEVKIKKDTKAKKKWYTTSGGGVYATASGGQVTGFGAGKVDDDDMEAFYAEGSKDQFSGAIIIDDPIKPDDADSEIIRNRINHKFNSTIRNRVNSRNTPIIIIMQRLHPDDLCGWIEKNDTEKWTVIKLPCIYKEDGEEKALWPFKHTLAELYQIRGSSNSSISVFNRQYAQDPKPLEGLLYTSFKTYEKLDFEPGLVYGYIDTADTGTDFLCAIFWTEHNRLKYVLDVIYSDKPNEVTEPLVSDALIDNNVNECRIESNNGGRAFARNVERITRESGNRRTVITWFHQSKNKETRIKSNSTTVQNSVVFPDNWAVRWPDYYDAMTGYMSAGGNKHDDAPDATTGMVENAAPRKMRVHY